MDNKLIGQNDKNTDTQASRQKGNMNGGSL